MPDAGALGTDRALVRYDIPRAIVGPIPLPPRALVREASERKNRSTNGQTISAISAIQSTDITTHHPACIPLW